jgi:sugar O-acyltransferase (sialic acid O-acetyltransferase NeuD family)
MQNPVLIFGAGSLALTALDIFQRNGVVVYGLLDDNKTFHGREFDAISVLGDTDDDNFLNLIGTNCEACIAIGNLQVHRRLVRLLHERRKVQPVNAIHDRATLSALASIGHGNLIAAGAIINPYATIGQHCIIQSGAVVESQASLGDFVHVGTGSWINSNVTIADGAFIGTGVTIIPGISIGQNARIGAGSVVVQPVEANTTVFGNPAQAV